MSYKLLYIITGLTEIIKNKKNNYLDEIFAIDY